MKNLFKRNSSINSQEEESLKNLFGRKSSSKSQGENGQELKLNALNNLKAQKHNLEEKLKLLELKIKIETDSAITKIKDAKRNEAKRCLERKKIYILEMKQLDSALMLLEEQEHMLLGENIQKELLSNIALTNEALKMSQASLDAVNDIKDDFNEILETKNEISNMFIASVIGNNEFEEELKLLETEMLRQKLPEPSNLVLSSGNTPGLIVKRDSDIKTLHDLLA